MYFSGSDVAIVAVTDDGRDIQLDSPFFQFQVSRAKLPIYGYKSVRFDTVANGEELVQGQFLLNFNDSAALSYFSDIMPLKRNADSNTLKEQDLVDVHFTKINIYYSGRHDRLLDKNPEIKQYTIIDVHLQSLGQSINAGGEPIGESYSFLARGINHTRGNERPDLITEEEDPELLGSYQDVVADLPITDFSIWEPLAPNHNRVSIKYLHEIYPIMWAQERYDSIPTLKDVSLWNWKPYRGFEDSILEDRYSNLASSDDYNDDDLSHNIKFMLLISPATFTDSSVGRVPDHIKRMNKTEVFSIPNSEMEITENPIGVNAIKSYEPKDLLTILNSYNNETAAKGIFTKYETLILEKLEDYIASSPGLHVISITELNFPYHNLKLRQGPTPDGSNEVDENETVWVSEKFGVLNENYRSPGFSTPSRYSNGKEIYLWYYYSGIAMNELIQNSALEQFLLSNVGDWIISETWEPTPDSLNNDNLA